MWITGNRSGSPSISQWGPEERDKPIYTGMTMSFSNCRFHTIRRLLHGAIALVIPGIRSCSTEPFRVAVLNVMVRISKKYQRRIMSSHLTGVRSCMASIANDATALRLTMLLFNQVTLKKRKQNLLLIPHLLTSTKHYTTASFAITS